MANRYWVGGTATWDATAGTKWASTSGGTGGQTVPGSGDLVYFDANSGANTVTLGINPTVSAVNCSGFTGTLAFGTQNITCVLTTANQWTQSSTMSVTGTPVVNINNTTSGTIGISVASGSVTEANAISFNIISGTGTATVNTGVKNLNLTGFAGTLANNSRTIFGDFTAVAGVTYTAGVNATSFLATSATQKITTNGQTLDFPITVGTGTSTNTLQLQDALTIGSTRNLTLTSGTLDLNSKTLTCGLFSSSNSNTRSILFGTGNITLTGSATTIWTTDTATNFSYTGTPTVNSTYSGSTGTRTMSFANTAGGTETNALNVNISAGSDSVGVYGKQIKNLNFTGFSGTATNFVRTIYGNLTLSSGMTLSSGTNATTFGSASASQQITTNGNSTIDFPITVGTGTSTNTLQLQDALTIGSTRTFTLTSGTLDLNNLTLTTGLFNANNTNNRSILFGTGNIIVTGSNATVVNLGTTTATGLTLTGTPVFNATYSGSTGARSIVGNTSSNPFTLNISAGSDNINLSNAPYFNNLNFTGFSGSQNNATGQTIAGNLTFSSSMTLSSSTGTYTFNGSSGTQIITTNGNSTIAGSFAVATSGSTVALNGALTTSGTLFLTSGTLDLTNNGAGNYTLTCNILSASNSNTRAIAFGTGNITLTGSSTNIISMGTATNFSYTGTPTVNCTYSGSTGSRGIVFGSTGGTESNALDFYVSAGSDTVSITTTTYVGTLNFTGFTGTLTRGNFVTYIYRNLNLGGITTYTSVVGSLTFAGTVATTQTITNSGVTINSPVTFFGTAIYAFQDALTMGSTRTLTFSSGTLQFKSGTTNAVGTFATSGTTQKYLISDTPGTQATISQASGTVSATYMQIQDSNATGGATWTAQYSANNGDNTGWSFLSPSYYNSSITEPSTLADIESCFNSVSSSIVENAGYADSESFTASFYRGLVENLTSNDVETGQASFNSSTTESTALLDIETVQANFQSAIVEPNTLADSENRLATFTRSITETLTSAEAEDRTAILFSSITEVSTEADLTSVQVNFNAAEVEGMAVLDSQIGRGWFKIIDDQNPNWVVINDTQ